MEIAQAQVRRARLLWRIVRTASSSGEKMVHDPSGSQKNGNDRPPAYWTHAGSKKKDGKEFKGLCVNCARRDECLLLNSEGGVWHCQEYLEEH